MYYGRKKMIIIAIVIIILVIILVGVGLFLFLKTDMFKSNETLFYKYLGEQLESLAPKKESTQQAELLEYKEQMPYTKEGELSVSYEQDTNEQQDELQNKITEVFGNLRLMVDGKYDKIDEKENTSYKLLYGTQNIFELDTAKTEDIYAMKSNEIVQNAYVGIRNDNLKVFTQKLIEESNMSQEIPDKLEEINILSSDLFEISEEELKHIQETYSQVISNVIKSGNYSKENNVSITVDTGNYECNSYRLDLTGEEVQNLVIAILTELQQDSITLNLISTKAKILGLSEDYTEINKLTTKIQNFISNIGTKLEKFKSGLSIIVYESEGKAVSLEVIIKNQEKYTISTKENGNTKILDIKIDNISTSEEFKAVNVNIIETKTSAQTMYQIDVNIDNETIINVSYESNGLASSNNVENQASVTFSQGLTTIIANYTEKLDFKDSIDDMVELNNTNTAILNDYTKEQLNMFIPAVMERVMVVYEEKLESLGIKQNIIQ